MTSFECKWTINNFILWNNWFLRFMSRKHTFNWNLLNDHILVFALDTWIQNVITIKGSIASFRLFNFISVVCVSLCGNCLPSLSLPLPPLSLLSVQIIKLNFINTGYYINFQLAKASWGPTDCYKCHIDTWITGKCSLPRPI